MTGRSHPKRYTLAAKFNILTVALILITSAGLCLYLVRLEMKNYRTDLVNHGTTIAQTTAKNCELGVYAEDRRLLLPILNGLSADGDIAYVSVLNKNRRQIAANVFLTEGPKVEQFFSADDPTLDDPIRDVVDRRNGRRYVEIVRPIVSASSYDMTDVALKSDEKNPAATVIGHIRLGLTLDSLNRRVRKLVISSVLFTTLIVLIGTALMLLLSRKITAPLERLRKATQEISDGKFDSPIDIRTNDEICVLAESFEAMRGRLKEYHAEVEVRIAKERQHVVEKEKILMDLHDGIGGITTNIRLLTELAMRSDDIADIRKKLNIISQLSQEGTQEIRSLMQGIDSKDMTWPGMAAYLRNQGSALLEPHRIQFNMDIQVEDVAEQPGSIMWVNVFKIYKETLTNVIKHAKAGAVWTKLQVNGREFVMAVRDDGIGYSGNENLGRGQSIMKKRAREMGGVLTVSSPNNGTLVNLQIPLPISYYDLKTHY